MKESIPATEALTLQWGETSLVIDQVADLSGLAHASLREGGDPYWAYLWPSARMLMDAIAHHAQQQVPEPPHRAYEGRRVLDLGCGLGAAGVLAGVLGASVTLADRRPEALMLAAKNAAQNNVDAKTIALDWDHPPANLGLFDAVVASDVLYEDGMLRGVLRFIKRHLKPTGIAMIADPMRVEPAGLSGAGRLLGLEIHATVGIAGRTHTGGVMLYSVTFR